MDIFKNQKCTVCEKIFDLSDDKVVCPVCGAPAHRECYRENGGCKFRELHAPGFDYNSVFKQPAAAETAEEEKKCPRCGVKYTDETFCNACGYPVNINTQAETQNGQPNPFPFVMRPGAFFNPMGAADPEEKIEGIEAKYFATFVGNNAYYFVTRFKLFSRLKGFLKKISLNLAAFFFTGYYFLYRKMYGVAAAFILIQLITNIATILLVGPEGYSGFVILPKVNLTGDVDTILLIIQVLGSLLQFAAGFYANSIYFAHAKNRIKKTKEKFAQDTVINDTLAREGRTMSVGLVLLICVAINFIGVMGITLALNLI